MGKSVKLKGTVFSGLGEGGFYVSIYSREFRRALGLNPYPGTLNVKVKEDHVPLLEECLRTAKPVKIPPPRIEGARLGSVLAFKAKVMGHDAYIVKPEITVYKADVVEFVARKYLRGLLGLEDGDEVEFEVYCDE